MRQHLLLHVPGLGVPQGSMRLVQGGKRMIHSNPQVRQWRATVASYAIAEIIHTERRGQAVWPATGPATLIATFHFPRPKHHYRTGKFASMLRGVAPREMSVGPDLDKLVRAIGDAMVDACVILDDRQINLIRAAKKWTEEAPYVSIQLEADRPS